MRALALVISLNIQRRDMTATQRAIVAARALDQIPERRGRPQKGAEKVDGRSTISRQTVARTFKVGEKAVQQAKALLADAPDLAVEVSAGRTLLAPAYEGLLKRPGRPRGAWVG